MAYAALTDVLALTGRGDKLLSRSSPLSAVEIEGFLSDFAAEIDSVLIGVGIDPPTADVSGGAPRAWNVLKRINTLGAAAQIELRLFGDPVPGASVRDSRGAIYRDQYEKLLTRIQDGTLVLDELLDAPVSDNNLASSGSNRTDSDNFFTREGKY